MSFNVQLPVGNQNAGSSIGGYQYEQHGSHEQDVNDQIYIIYNKLFGRDPTAAEIAQARPSYGNDPHITDVAGGNSFVSNLYQQQENTPDKLYAKQQAQYAKDAPQHFTSVNQAFQSLLGRDATDAEKSHFGSLLASGGVDQYALQNFLQQTPEYQQAQDQKFRQQLGGELSQADADYFGKYLSPQIQSQFANAGRSLNQPALSNAFAQAGQQQNLQRQQYLAQLSASQYAGRQGNARSDYSNYVNNLYNRGNADISTQLGYQQQNQQRQYDIQDFNMQQNAYNDYLQRYGKRGGWMNDLGTALNYANSFANIFKGFTPGSSGSPSMPVGQV